MYRIHDACMVYLVLVCYIWPNFCGKCIGKYTSPMDPMGMNQVVRDGNHGGPSS